jgi:hypothetical protein
MFESFNQYIQAMREDLRPIASESNQRRAQVKNDPLDHGTLTI